MSAPATPTVSPSAAATLQWTEVARTGSSSLAEDDTVTSALAFSGGFVMVGNAQSGDHGVLWLSSDGGAWERREADPPFTGSVLASVVAIPTGLLAVGTSHALDGLCAGGAFGCNPVQPIRMWTSGDGRTWEPVSAASLVIFGRAQLGAVASGPRGVIAFGWRVPVNGDSTPTAWVSADGRAWHESQLARAFPEAVVNDGAATTAGFVGVGRRGGSGPAAVGGAWFSADGQEWQQARSTGSMPELSHVVSATDGALASSAEGIWATADGLRWQSATAPFILGEQSPVFVSDGTRILALEYDSATGTESGWQSTDAQRWQPIAQVDAPAIGGGLVDREAIGTVGPGGIVLVITETAGGAFRSSVWFGAWESGP